MRMVLPSRSVSSTQGRRHRQRDRRAVAPDDQRQRLVGAELHDLLDVLEALDRRAVDR